MIMYCKFYLLHFCKKINKKIKTDTQDDDND